MTIWLLQLRQLRRVFVLRGAGKFVWLALAGSAMLAGCSLGPEYQRPDAPLPSAWREGSAAEAANWPSADWWHGFGSVELDQHISQAKRTNNDLAAAIARVREADALATVAGASLLPSVGLNATALNERVQSTSGNYANFRQYSPQLNASYMIDFWGKGRATQAAAIAAATASRHDQATVELTVMSSVALSYFQSIALRDRLAVAEANLANAESILKGLRRLLAAGITTALDVAQQETAVSALSATIPPLRQQLRQTVNALAILTGQPPETLEATKATLASLSLPPVRPGLPSELLTRRPDIASAEAQLVAANANISVARAAFYPNIQLTAYSGYASTALSTLLQPASAIRYLAVGLSQPIFDSGALKGQYAYTQARYDELLANYRKVILAAFGNVEDALVAVQQTVELERRQEITVAKASRAQEITQTQMRSGTVNVLTVLSSQAALYSARDALVQARFSHMQALVNLFSALGGGWQKELAT